MLAVPRPLTDSQVEDFRAALCDAALRRFARDGYAGITLRGLARDVGCSPMTPYRYFRDKDEIVAAVRAAAFGRFADRCEAASRSETDARAQLVALGKAYLEFTTEEPHAYRIMFEITQPHELSYPELAKQATRARQAKLDVVEACIRAGHLEGDPIEIANLLWAGMHGVIVLHLAGKLNQNPDLDALSREMMNTLLLGLTQRSTKEAST